MKKIFEIIIIAFSIHFANAGQSLQCGDWQVFKDEKCYKVFDTKELQTYDDAKKTCNENEGSSLVTITSVEEQNFLFDLIYTVHKNENDVWIGGQFNEMSFKWSDNAMVNFTNWANDNPRNTSGYDCVIMSMVEPNQGKWFNEACSRKNLVICQKTQNWLFSYLQMNVIELRKSFENITNHLENTIKELGNTKMDLQNTSNELANNKKELLYITHELTNTKIELENIVPVGFIYVQLPTQSEPKELWPRFSWTHISSQYSGHFFRVEGGNAAEFGTSQMDAFQGHDHEKYVFNETGYGSYTLIPTTSNWLIRLGSADRNFNHTALSNGYNGIPRNASETRPINYSVRVWKRIQ